jgi:hypothetical protein
MEMLIGGTWQAARVISAEAGKTVILHGRPW